MDGTASIHHDGKLISKRSNRNTPQRVWRPPAAAGGGDTAQRRPCKPPHSPLTQLPSSPPHPLPADSTSYSPTTATAA
eukprot:2281815-Rhodomonas_salina.1